jgi:hypothetical protein
MPLFSEKRMQLELLFILDKVYRLRRGIYLKQRENICLISFTHECLLVRAALLFQLSFEKFGGSIQAMLSSAMLMLADMKMSWLIASPVFAVDAGYSILQQTEAFSIGFSEWGKEFVTDAICLIQDEARKFYRGLFWLSLRSVFH